MTHPAVVQLRFARSECIRGREGLSEEDARKRVMPMNCISWNIGHLAWQEQRYWLHYAQSRELLRPEVDKQFAYGKHASTPTLEEALDAWKTITQAGDPWLDAVTTETLQSHVISRGKETEYIFGSLLLRTTYH